MAGLAHLFVQSARLAAAARRAPVALAAAASKLEQLLALSWTYDAAGASRSDYASDTSVDPPAVSGGTGLAVSPADTLARASPGYVDYLNAAGSSLSDTPAADAVFSRRWLVQAGPGLETLQLRVCVVRLSGTDVEPPPEACVGTVRVRR